MDDLKRTDENLKTVAIIPGAGSGVRMGAAQAKQFMVIGGRPLLSYTLEKFQICSAIESIILVVPDADIDFCRREIVKRYEFSKVDKVVAGGDRRQDSVRLGIEATEGNFELVLIHDGVRPLITLEMIERIVAAAKRERAVVAALPAKDTVKAVDRDGLVVETLDRNSIWLVQTPQVFRYEDIAAAHRQAKEECWGEMTDDSQMVEKMGIPVKVIQGEEDNIKVTVPHDIDLIECLLGKKW